MFMSVFRIYSSKDGNITISAILMVIAWVFFAGLGVISARYYKPVWSHRMLYGQKVWFQVSTFEHIFLKRNGWYVDITEAYSSRAHILTLQFFRFCYVNELMILDYRKTNGYCLPYLSSIFEQKNRHFYHTTFRFIEAYLDFKPLLTLNCNHGIIYF